jgi:hypothetical protein
MNLTPPAGSSIEVVTESGEPVITIPAGRGGAMRILSALFIAFWLCGWTAGFATVGSQVLSGKASAFSVFWLGGWTIGGCFAAMYLYRLVRPSIPETLRLGLTSVSYDSGVPPFNFNYYYRGYYGRPSPFSRGERASLFPKRTVIDIDRRQMQSLRLRETDGGNRLTVDAGATRLDLAQAASEVEREWLYRVLAEKYAVQAAPTGAVAAIR